MIPFLPTDRMNISQKIRALIEERGLLPRGSRVIAAVSGGADSVALLYLLHDLAGELSLTLSAAHFDHRIRPEAERERALVERHCARLGIPLVCGSGDVPARSRATRRGIEEAARILRYRFLEETARRQRADVVALGHTRNDQIETILHHIIRGTGWRGAAGIAPRRGIFVRPLLTCTREEIERFLKRRRIRFAVDRSNRDNRLFRNRIRNRLLPYLRQYFNPSIDEAIGRMGDNLEEGWLLLERLIPRPRFAVGGDGAIRISRHVLSGLGDFEIYLMIDSVLRDGFGVAQDIDKSHLDAVKRLIRRGRSGASVELPHGVTSLKDQRGIRLTARKEKHRPLPEFVIPGPGTYVLPGWKMTVRVAREDPPLPTPASSAREAYLASVSFPLRVRRRRAGDRMRPFGMRGRKKLSDLFIDRKIVAHRRDEVPVFEDAGGIVWVPGCATDERTRIRPGEGAALHITLARAAARRRSKQSVARCEKK